MEPAPLNDGLFGGLLGKIISSVWRMWLTKLVAAVNMSGGGGGVPPAGTGFRHITGGAEDPAAKLVGNADVAAAAGIVESKLALNYPTHPIPTGTGFEHVTTGLQDVAAKLVDTVDVNDYAITPIKTIGKITEFATTVFAFTYTQVSADEIIVIDATLHDATLYLTNPTTVTNKKIKIVNKLGVGNVKIYCTGGIPNKFFISGALYDSWIVADSNDCIEFISNGTVWICSFDTKGVLAYDMNKVPIGRPMFAFQYKSTETPALYYRPYLILGAMADVDVVLPGAAYINLYTDNGAVSDLIKYKDNNNVVHTVATTTDVPKALIYMGL